MQSGTKPKWKFFNHDATVPGALGWRKGKLGQKANKVKFLLDGRDQSLPIDTMTFLSPPPGRLRQTIRVGDVCTTAVLTCDLSGTSLKCQSSP